ncbi:hypothetical protein BC828DRAFT_382096 [Blastocladiella britannica]|nr:hypothetical protein BC828DRAFT_382096 [Blastocladiella britannica]
MSATPDFTGFPTDDPRMGHVLYTGPLSSAPERPDVPAHRRVCLLGFPEDRGVARNGGRVGAARGPAAAMALVRKVGTVVNAEYDGVDLVKGVVIAASGPGVDPTVKVEEPTLEVAHASLQTRVAGTLQRGYVPFVIGGGNDQSYPNVRALMDVVTGPSVAVINIDAHLDVRPMLPPSATDGVKDKPRAHSGSPFRQMLEDPDFAALRGKFVEFAAQGSQCSAAHVAYLKSKNTSDVPDTTEIVWLRDVEAKYGMAPPGRTVGTSPFAIAFRAKIDQMSRGGSGAVFVSFDLDSVCSADAPGVSCASPLGLSAQQALDICYVAGNHPAVRLFDLSEYNPEIEEYRTGRLVAFMFYHFCLGLATRPAQ